jgi:hypothetical protein
MIEIPAGKECYDTMTVHEIVNILEHEAVNGTGEKDAWAHRTQLILALRRAVIREASVGEIVIEQHEGYLSPDPLFSVGTESKLTAGTFHIIPKEEE